MNPDARWRAALAAFRRRPPPGTDAGWVGEAMLRTTPELPIYVFQGEATAGADLVVTRRGPGRGRLLGGASESAPWAEAVHPDDRPRYRTAESYAQLRKGRPIDVEFRLLGADGVERWMDEHLVPRWEGGRLMVDGIVIDVTSQRRSRIEAEQARRHLETVMRRADTYVWVAEVGADCVMRDVYSVAGIERMVGGLAHGESPQTAWRNAVHPEDLAAFDAALDGASRGESFDLEYRLVGQDGVTRVVRDQASVTLLGSGGFRIEGLVQEVTAEHEQRRALGVALALAQDRAEEVSRLAHEPPPRDRADGGRPGRGRDLRHRDARRRPVQARKRHVRPRRGRPGADRGRPAARDHPP